MAHRFPSRRWSSPSPAADNPKPHRPGTKLPEVESDSPSGGSSSRTEGAPSKLASSEPLFGCLVFSHFPIWAARFANVALVRSPLIIHRQGKVVAACALSLEAGVKIGWTLQCAQSLCPASKFQAESPCEIAYAWSDVLAALYGLTPCLEPVRPGLLFFGPPSPHSSSWLTTMAALAKLVKNWNAQAALATDRPTAELAAHTATQGRVRWIAESRNARNNTGFLHQTPSNCLCELGLSKASAERLEWFGFSRVADLKVLSREQIASQFADSSHPRNAALLWRFARAGTQQADRQTVQRYVSPPVCKSRLVFESSATCPAQWERALGDVIEQCAAQLNGLQAGVLSLQIETNRGLRVARKILREPLSNPRSLYRIAAEQAMGVLAGESETNPIELQAIEVLLSQLMVDGGQDTLFDSRRYDTSTERNKPPALLAALRNLESRHAGRMWKWRLRDQYAPLPEDQFSLTPAVDEFS